MNEQNTACSACYGSGYGVDGAACPCGCRPAPVPAIAPPVAAGSVDDLQKILTGYVLSYQSHNSGAPLDSILAWGAQQRQEGALASLQNYDAACDEYRKQIADLSGRAEKAEADLAQVNEWRATALASNQQMQGLMAVKLATAEARVLELESKLPKTVCWTPDCGTF